MRKKAIVLGSTGFIGRNIAERLSKKDGLDVYGAHFRSAPPEIDGVTPVRADLRDAKDVEKALKGMDIVIQAAATTSGAGDTVASPFLHVTDNAVMNSLILRAAYDHKIAQLVFFSCTVMYASGVTPLKESDFDAGTEMHPSYFGAGWTKVYIEKMCEFYSRLGGCRHTVIRHSNVYGPHDKFDLERSHVFGATIAKVMAAPGGGEVEVWGSGEEARDFLYISDLADFVELALERQSAPFGLFNAGSGQAVPVSVLVKRVIEHSGKYLKVRYDAGKPNIPTRVCLDSTRAKEALGWAPRVSLDEGIRKTLEWFRANRGDRAVEGGKERGCQASSSPR